ncbi:MAG: hypothetical protein ACI8QP_001561 [Porticoccaceae bacterium]
MTTVILGYSELREYYYEGNAKVFKKFKAQEVSYKIEYRSKKIISKNTLGLLKCSEFKDEVVVMTSHYEH